MVRQKNITNWDEVPVIIDLPMVMRILGDKSIQSLQKRCRDGKFPAFQHGRTWLVRKEDLIKYINGNAANHNTREEGVSA